MLLLPSLGLRWVSLLAMGAAARAFPEFVRFGLPIPTGDLAMADIAKARGRLWQRWCDFHSRFPMARILVSSCAALDHDPSPDCGSDVLGHGGVA